MTVDFIVFIELQILKYSCSIVEHTTVYVVFLVILLDISHKIKILENFTFSDF